MSSFLCSLITFYQRAVSPYLGARCRYVPSCSDYMKDAVRARGAFRGALAGIARILRCAPWGGHGLDLVNEKQS